MRKATAAVMVSTLAFSCLSLAADRITGDDWHPAERATPRTSVQSHMFDGIQLTEQQRQQLRDLMRQARHDSLTINVSEMEAMHRLVTAENFDEHAVRMLAEKMSQAQVTRQVEMAKVRNQMYNLLTPGQQSMLNKKHRQRMQELSELSQVPYSASPLFSSTRSNQ